jgi:site-specific DNA-methyltransferase (adenine-specific)
MKLYNGDCLKLFKKIPDNSVNLIFADPPYNLSGKKNLTVRSGKYSSCNKGKWDISDDILSFSEKWLKECIRVLHDNGTLWISGTLHNHPIIGFLLKKLNLWIINDVIWYKKNAPPLFSRNRLAPATELIWVASKSKKYFFNYELGKEFNNGKQLRNLWQINAQRHITKHPTEKPEKLLKRIILLGSKKGDTILDPFFGSCTTGVISKKLNRDFIGFELDQEYYNIGRARLKETKNETHSKEFVEV